MREQSTAGQLAARDIADAKDSIGDLHDKILEIKRKAVASEQMVQEICRDIRQLDVAKRHLTNTIMTLARLKTLASAVEQLSDHTRRRAYELAAPVLEAAIQLFTHFTDYRDVPKVAELAGAVERIREELRCAEVALWVRRSRASDLHTYEHLHSHTIPPGKTSTRTSTCSSSA